MIEKIIEWEGHCPKTITKDECDACRIYDECTELHIVETDRNIIAEKILLIASSKKK